MTKALRHTRHEIENAARVAAELNISVRLEPDGAITFLPVIHRAGTRRLDHGLNIPASPDFSDWLGERENEGKTHGNS